MTGNKIEQPFKTPHILNNLNEGGAQFYEGCLHNIYHQKMISHFFANGILFL